MILMSCIGASDAFSGAAIGNDNELQPPLGAFSPGEIEASLLTDRIEMLETTSSYIRC